MSCSRHDAPIPAVGDVAVPRARAQGRDGAAVRRLPAALAPVVRAAVPRLPDQITGRIRAEVGAFGGPGRRRLQAQLREAVTVAVEGFARMMSGDDAAGATAEEHFRNLGRAEALAGSDAARVQAALLAATASVSQTIHGLTCREELSGRAVAGLLVAVSEYLNRLTAAVNHGFSEERSARADVRHRLAGALLREGASSEATQLAAQAGWSLPDRAVVMVVQLRGIVPADTSGIPSGTLTYRDGDRLVVICEEERATPAREALLRLGPGVVVAQSWPVPPAQVRDGYRWACRALALARQGRLRPEGRVIHCERHRMTLLLAADPVLVDELSRKLLAPLLEVKPRRRLALAETLLAWLEGNEHAPALARRLGIHRNTVHNHLARLHELFGDTLHDPEQRTALILVLEAVVPSWRTELVGRHR